MTWRWPTRFLEKESSTMRHESTLMRHTDEPIVELGPVEEKRDPPKSRKYDPCTFGQSLPGPMVNTGTPSHTSKPPSALTSVQPAKQPSKRLSKRPSKHAVNVHRANKSKTWTICSHCFRRYRATTGTKNQRPALQSSWRGSKPATKKPQVKTTIVQYSAALALACLLLNCTSEPRMVRDVTTGLDGNGTSMDLTNGANTAISDTISTAAGTTSTGATEGGPADVTGPPPPCGVQSEPCLPRLADVLFITDYNIERSIEKWEDVRETLSGHVANLECSYFNFGVIWAGGGDTCSRPVSELVVSWDGMGGPYVFCNGNEAAASLQAEPSPGVGCVGAWYADAFALAQTTIEESRALHQDGPGDENEREYAIVLIVDSEWTDQTGLVVGMMGDDPGDVVINLADAGVLTYVIADATGGIGGWRADIGTKGQTGRARMYSDPKSLQMALDEVLGDIRSRICHEDLVDEELAACG